MSVSVSGVGSRQTVPGRHFPVPVGSVGTLTGGRVTDYPLLTRYNPDYSTIHVLHGDLKETSYLDTTLGSVVYESLKRV